MRLFILREKAFILRKKQFMLRGSRFILRKKNILRCAKKYQNFLFSMHMTDFSRHSVPTFLSISSSLLS